MDRPATFCMLFFTFLATHSATCLAMGNQDNFDPKYATYDNPIKTHITVKRSDDALVISLEYLNPTDSGKSGDWYPGAVSNKMSWQIFDSDGKRMAIIRPPNQPLITPPPIEDSDFVKLQPGEGGKKKYTVNLRNYQLHGEEHEYSIVFSYRLVPPSVMHDYIVNRDKIPYTPGATSNYVKFKYAPKGFEDSHK